MFRESLGIAPITYVRHHRMHGVRRVLLNVESRPGVVKNVALEWGFWHMGNFSATTANFSETPPERR